MAFGFIGKGLEWFGDRVKAEVERRVDAKLHQMGKTVVAKAKQLAPVRTGALRAGIHYKVTNKLLTILADEPYSLFVELGTRYQRPQPYIRPALNAARGVWGGRVELAWSVPQINQPILYQAGRYHRPPTLTRKQREHVTKYLAPSGRRHYKKHTARARFTVRKIP